MIMQVAEKFGQLPETIETEMSAYWFDRAVAAIHGESIENQRIIKEMARKT